MAGVNGGTGQRLQSSFGASSSSFVAQNQELFADQGSVPQVKIPQLRGRTRQTIPNSWTEDYVKKACFSPSHPQIPPLSPYSSIPANRYADQQVGLQNFNNFPTSLPPLIPSQYRDTPALQDMISADISMEETDGMANSSLPPSPFTRCSSSRHAESLPPRKAHRRSNSDIPFGFSTAVSPPPITPMRPPGVLYKQMFGEDGYESQLVHLSKIESMLEKGGDNTADVMGERKSEGEVVDDLFSAYMNLDNIDAFNSSGTDDKLGNDNREDLDSRASGTKTNDSSDNEATSGSVNESGSSKQGHGLPTFSSKREGIKRNAGGSAAPPATRHHRSVSMDSFMGKLNFGDESLKLPPPGMQPAKLSHADSLDSDDNTFSLDFGNGELTGAELKRIMANEKLAEIASSDPKRVKRILANRQSAARSKERKMRYIAELEHKVQTLQTEATTLSAQLTMLQRDSAGLTTQNNELKFRLQAMEQQAQLRDALNEALTAEVQRLKLSSTESNGDTSTFQQLSINSQMFQQQPRSHQSNNAKKRQ